MAAGLRCFSWLKYTQSDLKFLWILEACCFLPQLLVPSTVQTKSPLLWLWDMMEKMGKHNAWEAATRAQSFSEALWLPRFCAGCISTKPPLCLSNCLMQSKHNFLSTSLQLKYIKLVGGYLHCENVPQYEALCWNIVLTRICFSWSQTPFALFVLPAKSTHKSFPPWSRNVSLPVLQTPSNKGCSVSRNKGTWSSALSHQQWEPVLHGGKGSAAGGWKAKHHPRGFILQREVATSQNLF